jgi:CheY-like chemotaxis protein
MPEDGSPRPRPVRRLLLALARAAALFILVAGIYGAATIALPKTPLLNRAIASLLIGVVIYEMLRRPRRIQSVASAGLVEASPDNSEELLEAQHAVDRLRGEAEAARNREGHAREQYERENENLQRAANRALEEIQRVRSANDDLRGELEAQKTEAKKLALALTREHESASEKLRGELEAQKTEARKQALASTQEIEALRADRQRARREVEEAKQKAEVEKAAQRKTIEADWASKFKDVQRDLDLTRSSAQQLLQSNEALKQQLDEERQRLHAELQRIIGESKSERDEMQAEARTVAARLEELLAQLERERKLSQELSWTRARLDEENVSLKKRAEQLVEEHGAQVHQLETQWDAKLQKIVSGLAADHENDLGDAVAKREEARAEARSLQQQILKLERDREAMREKIDLEWGAKLQKIVTELASDHENDMGEAITAREAARAEVRSLIGRIGKLQEDNEALKRQLEAHARPAVAEEALREKIDAEWSEKLQTIVSHMASDHEADVGNAIEEREAARAEVRNLNLKLASLQQKLEAERKAHQSLETRLREAENQIRSAPTQPMAALTFPIETPPPPPPPQEEQQARAEVLQFAEQAQEAIRRITSPGDVPVPEEKKPRILIVHHDPALRSMWRENLGKSGFDVRTAADGLEGLRVVKAEKPDVVIADASMPKMDGRELCQGRPDDRRLHHRGFDGRRHERGRSRRAAAQAGETRGDEGGAGEPSEGVLTATLPVRR